MKKSRVTCKRFINMQCYIDTEHLDCAKCEKFEPLDHIAGDSKKVSDNVNSPAHYNKGGIECSTCFWYNDTCHNKQSPCYTHYRQDHDSCEWWEFANSEAQQSNDTVNHPNHYTQGGIECVDAMKACVSGLNEMEAACTSHALKYLWRWKHKNGAEDIRKCIWWLERLLKEVEDESKN